MSTRPIALVHVAGVRLVAGVEGSDLVDLDRSDAFDPAVWHFLGGR
jgi:hypothetical protein